MVAYWRQAGLRYIHYSQICAQAVRAAMKPQYKAEVERAAMATVKTVKPKKEDLGFFDHGALYSAPGLMAADGSLSFRGKRILGQELAGLIERDLN
ncbi:ATP synthase subunit epsilon, mitochondrial [Aix galericulata]|nr:ATP synthase subunit epsilon, mitochondrial [Aix galericulata]